MKLLRALALMVACVIALAACAAPAAQDTAGQQLAAAATTPAPRHISMPRTGGPLPPQRADDRTCKVDADCAAKPHCAGTECRCVRDTCIAKRDAVDPVIDPAPASSIR
jgi:hypothetical protein